MASIKTVYEESTIVRRDRQKTITVGAYVEDGYNALAVFDQIKPFMEELAKDFPLGYYYEFGGEFEASGKANKSIMTNIPLTFMAILLVLVIQFNSIKKPLIILTTIPLGIIGVAVGLFITNSYFGFLTLLGVISLAGIVS